VDCNQSGVADAADIAAGKSADCNANGVPDECDIAFDWSIPDDNANLVPDACEPAGSVAPPPAPAADQVSAMQGVIDWYMAQDWKGVPTWRHAVGLRHKMTELGVEVR
jgi:hypothetical protein